MPRPRKGLWKNRRPQVIDASGKLPRLVTNSKGQIIVTMRSMNNKQVVASSPEQARYLQATDEAVLASSR